MTSRFHDINIKLIFSVCAVQLLAFSAGNAYAWASSVVLSLKSEDPEINPLDDPITSFEESWITSSISLGAIIGNLLSGFCSQKFGRKPTLLALSLPMLASHAICFFVNSAWQFILARLLIGMGCGCVFTVIPIYSSEIAETSIRGLLGTMMPVFVAIGMLYVYAVGSLFSLKVLSITLTVPIFLFQFSFGLFVPESPYYYITSGNAEAAETTLKKLRNKDQSIINQELEEIRATVELSKNIKLSFDELVKSRSFKKGMIIVSVIIVLQQFTGIMVILSYMEDIFLSSGSSLSAATSTIIIAILQVFIVGLSSLLVDKLGRRFLLLFSCGGTAVSYLILGLYFFLKNNGIDVSSLGWLPITSLISFTITYNIGFGPLPWILTGEVFSPKTKNFASTITATINVFFSFIVALSFPSVKNLIGYGGVFCFFATSSFLCFLFVLWYVPETKGKSFIDILEMLEN